MVVLIDCVPHAAAKPLIVGAGCQRILGLAATCTPYYVPFYYAVSAWHTPYYLPRLCQHIMTRSKIAYSTSDLA
jgi:hypothetical protein